MKCQACVVQNCVAETKRHPSKTASAALKYALMRLATAKARCSEHESIAAVQAAVNRRRNSALYAAQEMAA